MISQNLSFIRRTSCKMKSYRILKISLQLQIWIRTVCLSSLKSRLSIKFLVVNTKVMSRPNSTKLEDCSKSTLKPIRKSRINLGCQSKALVQKHLNDFAWRRMSLQSGSRTTSSTLLRRLSWTWLTPRKHFHLNSLEWVRTWSRFMTG